MPGNYASTGGIGEIVGTDAPSKPHLIFTLPEHARCAMVGKVQLNGLTRGLRNMEKEINGSRLAGIRPGRHLGLSKKAGLPGVRQSQDQAVTDSPSGTRVTLWACSIGNTSRAKRRICSINISCGSTPRLRLTCTLSAPALSAASMIRRVTSSAVPQGISSA